MLNNQYFFNGEKFHESSRPTNNRLATISPEMKENTSKNGVDNNNQEVLHTLHPNLDNKEESLELKKNLFKISYCQWELDDQDDKRLLENLKQADSLKSRFINILPQDCYDARDEIDYLSAQKLIGIQTPKAATMINQKVINGSPDRKKEKISLKKGDPNAELVETLVSEYTLYHSQEKNSIGSEDMHNDKKALKKNIILPCEKIEEAKIEHTTSHKCESEKVPSSLTKNENTQLNKTLREETGLIPYKLESKLDNNDDSRYSDLHILRLRKEKDLSKPIRLNIMVVGKEGLGKSTFIDALLEQKFEVREYIRPSTSSIIEKQGIKTDGKTTFEMNFLDTPGYSNGKNIHEWYKMIKDYICNQFHEYRKTEKDYSIDEEDKRVHLCLYFLSGPRVNMKDLIYMKKMQKYTNILPIIARGDSYTVEEIKEIKINLIQAAHDYKIEWLDLSLILNDNKPILKELNESRFGPCPPFLIISSIHKLKISPNKYIYGREYPWGICDIKNPNHSDFLLLYNLFEYICIDCINFTKYYHKNYFKKLKQIKKNQQNQSQKKTNIGIGTIVAAGILGALMAVKKNLF